MPLARGARELEGGMHHIGLEAHSICHALHKEGVPTAEGGHRQNAHLELPIKAPVQHLLTALCCKQAYLWACMHCNITVLWYCMLLFSLVSLMTLGMQLSCAWHIPDMKSKNFGSVQA